MTTNKFSPFVIGISSAILVWMLYAEHHARSPLMSQIALFLAVVGAHGLLPGSVVGTVNLPDFNHYELILSGSEYGYKFRPRLAV